MCSKANQKDTIWLFKTSRNSFPWP